VVDALEAGAAGYVLKEAADRDLVLAAEQVVSGGRFVSRALDFEQPARYVPAKDPPSP
jgi:DNA-binding NarL/FixJ family response regulator